MSRLGDSGPTVIVGGGLAGSLLAIYLADLGHEITVYESRPDLRTVDISAGRSINLALALRGMVPLREVGVMDLVDDIVVPMPGRMVHSFEGESSFHPYGIHESDAILSVSRTDLNSILLDAAEATGRVNVVFEQRCRNVNFETSELTFTDVDRNEYTVPFGTVFGADGANSPTRSAMMQVNGGTLVEDPLEHGYKELVVEPAADGSYQMEPNALHIWPRGGFMLIALPNPGGNFTVTLFMPHAGDDSFDSLNSDAEVIHFFEREFPHFVPLKPDLARDFFDGPRGSLSTIRCTGWSHGDHAVLVGDAAHGIVPFHGQGMNAAMESCRVLYRHLAAQPDDVAAAFRAFEQERKPDTDAIAAMALQNYVEMRSDVIDPGYLIRRAVSLELERRFPDRYAARYGMVTFHTMGYAEAMHRAAAQLDVLHKLTDGVADSADVDMDEAARLVAELDPLPAIDPGTPL